MVEIGAVFTAIDLAQRVFVYMGIIEDRLHVKMEQLAGSELEAGLRAFEQAINSRTE